MHFNIEWQTRDGSWAKVEDQPTYDKAVIWMHVWRETFDIIRVKFRIVEVDGDYTKVRWTDDGVRNYKRVF